MSHPSQRNVTFGWNAGGPLCDNGLQSLDRILTRCPADIAGAVVMVIRENAADLSVMFDARRPVVLIAVLFLLLLRLCVNASIWLFERKVFRISCFIERLPLRAASSASDSQRERLS